MVKGYWDSVQHGLRIPCRTKTNEIIEESRKLIFKFDLDSSGSVSSRCDTRLVAGGAPALWVTICDYVDST